MGCKQSKDGIVARVLEPVKFARSAADGTLLRSGSMGSNKSIKSSKSEWVARKAEVEQESARLLSQLRMQAVGASVAAVDLPPGSAERAAQAELEETAAFKTAQLAIAAVECATSSSRAAAWAACDAAWAAASGTQLATQVAKPLAPRAAPAVQDAGELAPGQRCLVGADRLFCPQPPEEDGEAEGAAGVEVLAGAAEVEVLEAMPAPDGERGCCLGGVRQESNPFASWASSFVACRPACRGDAETVDDVCVAGKKLW